VADGFRAGVRLRRIGRHLRHWREQAGMRGTDAAARLKWSPSKISKMEHAAQAIMPVDVLALGLIYQVDPGERDRLFEDAQRATQEGWWQEYAEDELIEITRDYLELESEATLLRTFKTDLVPGLLQTSEYATALARTAQPRADEETIRRRVEIREKRKQLLLGGKNPLRIEAVLTEAVLRTAVGGAEEMRTQLHELAVYAKYPHITIHVIPFEAGAYPGMGSPFDLLGFAEEHYDDVAYVENLGYGLLLEDSATVQSYKLHFTGQCEVALDQDASIAMIAKTAKAAGR
jgi:transcriptional regulator with XRE-family HTH domain